MAETNWEAVELDYRAGVLPIGTICRRHDVRRDKLMLKVTRSGWTRDLLSQVRAEVSDRLLVSYDEDPVVSDHVTISAEVIVQVVKAHRADIGNMRATLGRALTKFDELMSSNFVEEVQMENGSVVLRPVPEMMMLGKSQSIANALDALASAFQRVITLERAAYGIDAMIAPGSPGAMRSSDDEGGQVATVQVYLPANHREPRTT